MGDNGKNLGGRPTDYKIEYCKDILEFFTLEPYRSFLKKTITKKNGEVTKEFEERGNNCPFIGQFARDIGVSRSAITRWAKKYPEFQVALKEAKKLQEEHIATNGLNGSFNSSFSIFTLKNVAGWRDRTDPSVVIEDHKHFTSISLKELVVKDEAELINLIMGKRY